MNMASRVLCGVANKGFPCLEVEKKKSIKANSTKQNNVIFVLQLQCQTFTQKMKEKYFPPKDNRSAFTQSTS